MKLSAFIIALVANASVGPATALIPKDTSGKSLASSSLQSFSPASPSSIIDMVSATQPAVFVTQDNHVIHHATSRKKWGVDNTQANEYWFDRRIHSLGNDGFWGALHAAMAPISTKMIDVLAYDGVDIRHQVAEQLRKTVKTTSNAVRVLDMCCGVGMSTRALREAFPEAETVVGLDTSSEMLAMANFLTGHLSFMQPFLARASVKISTGYSVLKERSQLMKKAASDYVVFARGNAEDTKLPCNSFDLVTVMYAFHEAPMEGRDRILQEARRLLQPGGVLAVVDISTEYKPSETMLKGEPYVLEYQENINRQLSSFNGFVAPQYTSLVAGHVGMWVLERSAV